MDIMAVMDIINNKWVKKTLFKSPLGNEYLFLGSAFSIEIEGEEVQPLDPFFPICPKETMLI
jgi:hypothetical protein